MFSSLCPLFSFSAGNARREAAPARRRARLGVEVLEGRALPTASAFAPPAPSHSAVHQAAVATPTNVVDVPYLVGVNFTLDLTVHGRPYQLKVTSETYNADGSASLTCTLTVPGQAGSQSYQARYADLKYTNGGLHIDSEFDTGAGASIEVAGWISTVPNPPVRSGIAPTGYYYEFVGAISFFQNQQVQKIDVNVGGEGYSPSVGLFA